MSLNSRPQYNDYIPEDSQEGLQRIKDGTAHLQDSSERQEQVARPTQTAEEVQERESTQDSQRVFGGIDIFDNGYSSEDLNDSISQLNQAPNAMSLKELAIVRSEERRIASIATGLDITENKQGSVQDVLTSYEKGKGVLGDLRINLKGANLKVYNQSLRYEGNTLRKFDTCHIDNSADPLLQTLERRGKIMLMVAITGSEGQKGYTAAHAIEPIPNPQLDEVLSRIDNPNSWGLETQKTTPQVIKNFIQFNKDEKLAVDPEDFDLLERASKAFPLGFKQTIEKLKEIQGSNQIAAAKLIRRISSINTEDLRQANIEAIVKLYEEVKTLLPEITQQPQASTTEEGTSVSQQATPAEKTRRERVNPELKARLAVLDEARGAEKLAEVSPTLVSTAIPQTQTKRPEPARAPQPEPQQESNENLEQTDSGITKTLFEPKTVSADGLKATYNPDAVKIMSQAIKTVQDAKSAIQQIEQALLYYRDTKGQPLQTDLSLNLNLVKSSQFNTFKLDTQIKYIINIMKPVLEAKRLPRPVIKAIDTFRQIDFKSIHPVVREFDYRDAEYITKGEPLMHANFSYNQTPSTS